MSSTEKHGAEKKTAPTSKAQTDSGPSTNPTQEQASPGTTNNLTDDQQTFAKFYEVSTGRAPSLETPHAQRAFEVDYNRWVAAGRPRPKLEQEMVKGEAPIPMKLYRVKSLGKQYVFFRDTKSKIHGRATDSEGVHTYNSAFKKDIAQELKDDAVNRCHNPTYYLVVGGAKYSVNEEDWVSGDFDQLVQMHRQGRYIA